MQPALLHLDKTRWQEKHPPPCLRYVKKCGFISILKTTFIHLKFPLTFICPKLVFVIDFDALTNCPVLNVHKGWNLKHRNSTSGSWKKPQHKIHEMEAARMFVSICDILD